MELGNKCVRKASQGNWMVLRPHWQFMSRNSKRDSANVIARIAATLQADWKQNGGGRPLVLPAAGNERTKNQKAEVS